MERKRKESLLETGYKGCRTSIQLELPRGTTLNIDDAGEAIRDICYKYDWNYEMVSSGGRLYPCDNYGNLEVACASKDDGSIIGMIVIHNLISTNSLKITSDLEGCIDYVKPEFSSLAEIESPELRKFVGALYERFYEVNPRRRK